MQRNFVQEDIAAVRFSHPHHVLSHLLEDLLGDYFTGDDGEISAWQPLRFLWGIPLNAIVSVGFTSLYSLLEDLYETWYLLTNLTNKELSTLYRAEGPLAAILSMIAAGYLGLYAMALSRGESSPSPFLMIEAIQKGPPDLQQLAIYALVGLIALKNGRFIGRDLLQSTIERWQAFWPEIYTNYFLRQNDFYHAFSMIPHTDIDDPEHAVVDYGGKTIPVYRQKHLDTVFDRYKANLKENWSYGDVAAQVVKNILKLPLLFFQLPLQHTKLFLQQQGYFEKTGPRLPRKTIARIPGGCTQRIFTRLGWSTPIPHREPVLFHAATGKRLAADWPTLKDQILTEYKTTQSHPAANKRLTETLIRRYKAALTAFQQQKPLAPPLLPQKDAPHPLTKWEEKAAEHPDIKRLVSLELSPYSLNIAEIAEVYQSTLLGIYTTGAPPTSTSSTAQDRSRSVSKNPSRSEEKLDENEKQASNYLTVSEGDYLALPGAPSPRK